MVPQLAVFLAGVAAGALTLRRSVRSGPASAETAELKRSVAGLELRLAAQASSSDERFQKIETRLEEHSAKLAEIPTTAHIVGAMEQVLAKTMASLDERLTTQAHSIEILKTTVSQTDSLLERVLESLDSLQSLSDPSALVDDSLLHRPAV